jgi:hypothetical protein
LRTRNSKRNGCPGKRDEGAKARPAAAFGPNAFFLDSQAEARGFGEASAVAPAAEKMARTAVSRRP